MSGFQGKKKDQDFLLSGIKRIMKTVQDDRD